MIATQSQILAIQAALQAIDASTDGCGTVTLTMKSHRLAFIETAISVDIRDDEKCEYSKKLSHGIENVQKKLEQGSIKA